MVLALSARPCVCSHSGLPSPRGAAAPMTSRRTPRLNTGRSNRAAQNVLSSRLAKSTPQLNQVPELATTARFSTGRLREKTPPKVHRDDGSREVLEPVFRETHDTSDVVTTQHHQYVVGEPRAYGLYIEETPISQKEGKKMAEARMYSDKSCITPHWLKVSATPWFAPSKATGGYGRKIHDTSVSTDAPDIFHVDGIEEHDEQAARNSNVSFGAAPRPHRDGASPLRRSVSQDAPDFFHLQSRNPPTGNLKYTKMIYQKQILIEPPTPRAAAHWSNTPRHLLPSCRSLRGESTNA